MPRVAFLLAVLAVACVPPPDRPGPTAPDAVPEAAYDHVALRAFAQADGSLLLPALETPEGATRVGALLTLTGPEALTPRVLVRTAGGAFRPLAVTYREADQAVLVLDLPTVAERVELRVDDATGLRHLLWSAVVPPPPPPLGEPAGEGAPLRSELVALGVHPREDWDARTAACASSDPTKYRMAIHHTVTPATQDPAVRLRAIQRFHMDSRGWCDIGYHFLVALDGSLWEGRPLGLLGTHVGGGNTGNIGISFIGCFHDRDCSAFPPNEPPDAMVEAAARLVEELADLHGIAVDATSVKGHRDHTGASTACPGDFLHDRLPEIRAGAPGSSPAFAAAFVEQSFPLARDGLELAPGGLAPGYLELRNVGAATWRPGETFLGTTEPRDSASPLAGPDWVASNRPATVDREVAPGGVGRFAFTVRAPTVPGDYPQFLNVVQEGVAWVSDEGQGGPIDRWFQLRVRVVSEPPPPPPADAGAPPPPPPPPDPDAGVPAGAPSPTGARGVGPGATVYESPPAIVGGCQVPGRRRGRVPPVSLLALIALLSLARGGSVTNVLAPWRRRSES